MNQEQEEIKLGIEQVNSERKKTFDVIETYTKELDEIFMTLSLQPERVRAIVTFEQAKLIPLGRAYRVSQLIKFIKHFESGDTIRMICYAEKGAEFSKHSHNCLEETTVISGHLIETTRGNTEILQGQTITYKPTVEHKPIFKKDTVLEVIFTKQKKLN